MKTNNKIDPTFVPDNFYEDIDPIIFRWANQHQIKVITDVKEWQIRIVLIKDWSILIEYYPQKNKGIDVVCTNQVNEERRCYPATIRTLGTILDEVYRFVTRD